MQTSKQSLILNAIGSQGDNKSIERTLKEMTPRTNVVEVDIPELSEEDLVKLGAL